MELTPKLSCDGFPTDSDTSSKSGVDFPCGDKKGKIELAAAQEQDPSANMVSISSSSSSTLLSGYFHSECRIGKTDRKEPPNIGYEMSIAKTIMQQYSTLSGDNLFDHLSDIIKRVIDERPPNVIDFFEEFSRNVREQKFHIPERFPPDAIYEESRMYRVAKKFLLSMKLPIPVEEDFGGGGDVEENAIEEHKPTLDLQLDIHETQRLFITFNERVQQMQFYWNQCGFSISSDDIFQMACAMDRLQTHPSILQSRFWGVINGLKASYYIVEASLTQEEINVRLDQMEQELIAKQEKAPRLSEEREKILPSFVGPEMQPGGLGWENWPIEEIEKMTPNANPVPLVEVVEVFDIPPESYGVGCNRYSYFVVNAVSDDWIELPIVTPKQIIACRQMKKFLTGDLESEVVSYPCFPGKEKHYLRALIARITAGTYIAPRGYFRKMTKRERRQFEGMFDDEMEEEEEEEPMMMGEGEEEEEVVDNDIVLLKNEKYEPKPINTLSPPSNWVHTRPNILNQGRVTWFDEIKASKDRSKEIERMRRAQMMDEMEEEEEEAEAEAEGEEEDLLDGFNLPEVGPPIMNPCHFDISDEYTVPWIARFTSRYTNKNERVIIMQSNIWPGSYTFTFEKICDTIYMGWGHKYTSRNIEFVHLPPIFGEYPHGIDDFIETTDPTVADEEAYRLSLLKKEKPFDDFGEHLSDFDEDEHTHESGSDNEEE